MGCFYSWLEMGNGNAGDTVSMEDEVLLVDATLRNGLSVSEEFDALKLNPACLDSMVETRCSIRARSTINSSILGGILCTIRSVLFVVAISSRISSVEVDNCSIAFRSVLFLDIVLD